MRGRADAFADGRALLRLRPDARAVPLSVSQRGRATGSLQSGTEGARIRVEGRVLDGNGAADPRCHDRALAGERAWPLQPPGRPAQRQPARSATSRASARTGTGVDPDMPLRVRHDQARGDRGRPGAAPQPDRADARPALAPLHADLFLRRGGSECGRPRARARPGGPAPHADRRARRDAGRRRLPPRHPYAGAETRRSSSTSEVREQAMAQFLPLAEAIEASLRDGDTVAMEGFTHLIPHAAGHEVIRQGRRDLTLVRMTPDLIYDQLIGMGCAEKTRVLVGRQSGRRLAAPAARCGRARLAAAARDRGAQPRRDGERLRGGGRRPALRDLSRLSRRRARPRQSQHQVHRLPVHGRGAGLRAGAPARLRDHSCAEGEPTRATC